MKIFEIFRTRKFFENSFFQIFSKNFEIENFHWKLYENEKIEIEFFDFFGPTIFRTQTDRAPRDFYEMSSGQNVVKIMVFYFP